MSEKNLRDSKLAEIQADKDRKEAILAEIRRFDSLSKEDQEKERSKLLGQLSMIGGDPEQYQESDSLEIKHAIEMQKSFNQMRAELDDKIFTLDLESQKVDESGDDLRTDFVKYREYRDYVEEKELDPASEEGIKMQNLLTLRRNRIRGRLGLDSMPLIALNSDLEVLLELDGGRIGQTTEEWLQLQDRSLRSSYRERLLDLIRLKDLQQRQTEADSTWWTEILYEYEEIKVPVQKTVGSGTDLRLNELYPVWISRLQKLLDRVTAKVRAEESKSRDDTLGDTIHIDRRSRLFRLERDLKKLLEDNQ